MSSKLALFFPPLKGTTGFQVKHHIYAHTDLRSALMFDLKFQTLVGTDFLTASECVSVSFSVWADVSVHDVAVMLVKLL